MGYLHQGIEKKWQDYGNKNQTFFTDLLDRSKPKKYILAMFPYPSGSGLHVGHIRNYTIADALARFYRLNGYNVLLPIGWDAFGLPAEQYAIQTGNHPANFTNDNIQKFKTQLLRMGFSYDGSKEINTSEPNYYHGTQGIFKQIYLQKLAEYKEIPVYWCEQLGTVLANEEIKLIDGQKVSERGSYPVVQKSISQGVLKITNYAEQLLNDLQQIDWPNSIKSLQTNGIGLSQGTLIDFSIFKGYEKITVFTTRPDTIYRVAAIALSIDHHLIEEIVLPDYFSKVIDFRKNGINKKRDKEIAGEFTGIYCLNPLNNEKVPVGITNFVVSGYGTGAVMMSPYFSGENQGDDSPPNTNLFTEQEKKQNREVDFTFAKKYGLLKKKLVSEEPGQKYYVKYDKKKEIELVNQELEKKGGGQRTKIYHLRDGVFSRQRYGGEPVPIIHGENGEKEILKDEQFPLNLPPLADFTPSPLYYSPLQKINDGVNVKREDGMVGKRDVNVMPQGAGSCGYYIAFLLRKNDTYLALNSNEAKEIIKHGLPVDIYIGGQEHANLHLLYARFGHKILAKIGIFSQPEPFQKLLCQGMILGADGEKMSKSRGNIINPNELVEKYGADALRLSEVFLGPPEQTTNFDPDGVRAMKKGLDRVYNFFLDYREAILTNIPNQEIETAYHELISKTTDHYKNVKLNLVVSSLMTFVNTCYKAITKIMPLECFLGFLQVLNPLAPHLSEEMWSYFETAAKSISYSNGPQLKELQILSPRQVNMVVQINGQKKIIILVKGNKKQKEIEEIVKNHPKIKKIIGQHEIIKIVFIDGKLINFVVK